MNRVFGADDLNGPTREIARFVEETLISQADYAIDLHSGGKMCEFSPCGYIYGSGDREHLQAKLSAAHHFGAQYTVVVEGSQGSLSAAGERAGLVMLSAELGGGRIRQENIDIGYTGTMNTLAGWGLMNHDPKQTTTCFLRSGSASSSVMSPVGGVFEPLTDVGQSITAGDEVGRIYALDSLDQPVTTVSAEADGIAIGQRAQACVQRGDFLLHLADPVSESVLLEHTL
jgi:predicted deacylase